MERGDNRPRQVAGEPSPMTVATGGRILPSRDREGLGLAAHGAACGLDEDAVRICRVSTALPMTAFGP